MTTNDILFEQGPLATITLNRPQALNALSYDMFLPMKEHLLKWELDDSVKAVMIKSNSEKAFCAGGDIRAIYDNKHKTPDELHRYFQLEYEINSIIFHYKKPYIALINGITMGGGVGVSLHSAFSIASEDLRWAMPETLIGFFPDVGATYHLSRLPFCIGIYLALTGRALSATEALQLKLIQYIVPREKFDGLEKKLTEALSDINGGDREHKEVRALASTSIASLALPEPANLDFQHRELIAECFRHKTIEQITQALTSNNNIWCQETRQLLSQRSPISLRTTLDQLHRAKKMTFDEVIAMDLQIAREMLAGYDFFEGIRAMVVDKDKQPKWA